VAAATGDETTDETQWGWIAFGILAAGVIGFLIYWLVRRNRDHGSPPEPPTESE
jgi:high-affinity Fe2+/Pb2+ permease